MLNAKEMIKMRKRTILIMILIFGIASNCAAKKYDKITPVDKEVTGTVSAVNKDFIGIVYSRDEANKKEYEVGIYLDGDYELEHKKDISEIKPGDTVTIVYEEPLAEYTEKDKEGKEERKTKTLERKAKIIKFVRPAPRGRGSGLGVLRSGLDS
ncbi:hypothetical protein ACFL0T_05430 [Candidatus Omnitrophota bacterium]